MPFDIDRYANDQAVGKSASIRVPGRLRGSNKPVVIAISIRSVKGDERSPLLPYRGMSKSLRPIILTDGGQVELDPVAAAALAPANLFVVDAAREAVVAKFSVDDTRTLPYLTLRTALPKVWERRGRTCVSSPSFDVGLMAFSSTACNERHAINDSNFEQGTRAQTELAKRLIPELENYQPSHIDHILHTNDSGVDYVEVSRLKGTNIVVVQMLCECE